MPAVCIRRTKHVPDAREFVFPTSFDEPTTEDVGILKLTTDADSVAFGVVVDLGAVPHWTDELIEQIEDVGDALEAGSSPSLPGGFASSKTWPNGQHYEPVEGAGYVERAGFLGDAVFSVQMQATPRAGHVGQLLKKWCMRKIEHGFPMREVKEDDVFHIGAHNTEQAGVDNYDGFAHFHFLGTRSWSEEEREELKEAVHRYDHYVGKPRINGGKRRKTRPKTTGGTRKTGPKTTGGKRKTDGESERPRKQSAMPSTAVPVPSAPVPPSPVPMTSAPVPPAKQPTMWQTLRERARAAGSQLHRWFER